MKRILLNFIQKIISKIKFPGRYILATTASRLLFTKNETYQGKIGSYSISCHLQDPIQRLIFFGLYELMETGFIEGHLRDGDVFFDIGANVGYFSLLASQLVGEKGMVYSFEPIPRNLEILNQAIIENEITNIRTKQTAVGSKEGVLELYVGSNEIGNSSAFQVKKNPKMLTASVISLDSYIRDQGIQGIRLIKIDVEGWEYEVFEGMHDLLISPVAPDLVFEINPYFLSRGDHTPQELIDYLSQKGYFVYDLKKKIQVPPNNEVNSFGNYFATKNPREEW